MGAIETKADPATPAAADPPTGEIKYPGVFLSSVLQIALRVAMFLVALDMASLAQQDPAGNCDSKKIKNIDHCSHGDSHPHSRVSQRRPGRLVRISLIL